MERVPVVELRRMTDDFTVVPVIRYLLLVDGSIEVAPLEPGSSTIIEQHAHDGIPGEGRLLFPGDGEAFLQGLPRAYSGSRLWATPPFVMDLDVARMPLAPVTLPARRPPPPPRNLTP